MGPKIDAAITNLIRVRSAGSKASVIAAPTINEVETRVADNSMKR
jgi:hypothetical protein